MAITKDYKDFILEQVNLYFSSVLVISTILFNLKQMILVTISFVVTIMFAVLLVIENKNIK